MDLTKSKTVFALLGWLSASPMSGYDLKKQTERYIGNFWYGSFGQIYPLLHQMHEEELVTVREEKSKGRPAKKVYTITDSGRDMLTQWLAEPSEPDLFRSELMLKVFFGSLCKPIVLQNMILALREQSNNLLSHYDSIEEEVLKKFEGSPQHPYLKITLDRGKIIQKGYVEWADNTLKTLLQLEAEEK